MFGKTPLHSLSSEATSVCPMKWEEKKTSYGVATSLTTTESAAQCRSAHLDPLRSRKASLRRNFQRRISQTGPSLTNFVRDFETGWLENIVREGAVMGAAEPEGS